MRNKRQLKPYIFVQSSVVYRPSSIQVTEAVDKVTFSSNKVPLTIDVSQTYLHHLQPIGVKDVNFQENISNGRRDTPRMVHCFSSRVADSSKVIYLIVQENPQLDAEIE
jgi:hypothetical protein